MTTSVRDLLNGIHARSWELAGVELPAAGAAREAWAAGLLAAWPRLAASTVRALDAVPLAASRQDDVGAVRDSLSEVVRELASWRAPRWSVDRAVPNREVLGIALRVGAIADLLVGQPTATLDGDQTAAVGLQANLLAPVPAVAATTLAALEGLSGVEEQRWVLRRIVARTEPYALVEASTARAATTTSALRLLVRCRWMG